MPLALTALMNDSGTLSFSHEVGITMITNNGPQLCAREGLRLLDS